MSTEKIDERDLDPDGLGPANQGAPDQDAPDQGASDQAAPDQGASDQAAPDQGASDQAAPDQGASDQVAPDLDVPRLDTPKSVLGRAFCLLTAFTPNDMELSLGELCERTGLPKTTVHRLAGELIGLGALERGRYGVRLGLKLFTLGEQVPRHRRLRDLAMPYLEDLYEATHESAHLALLDGTDVVYLAKVCGHQSAPTASAIGGRLPTHCTAVGKALLSCSPTRVLVDRVKAGLPRRTPLTLATPGALERDLIATAERGFSVDREETRMGIVSVGAPIFGAGGRPVAAIAIAGRTHTIRIDQLAPAVQAAARGLSQSLARSTGMRTP